jgi:hypothetical protein
VGGRCRSSSIIKLYNDADITTCHFRFSRPRILRLRCSLVDIYDVSGHSAASSFRIQITFQINQPNRCNNFSTLFIHPKPLPKRALHIVRFRASSFKWECPLLSLRPSNSFLRLFPSLPVTSIPPCIFPSITRCRRQFLRKMWLIQFAFRLRISCRIFICSLTLSNTSSFPTWSVQLISSILLQHHISKLSRCFWSTARSVQVSASYTWRLFTAQHISGVLTSIIRSSTAGAASGITFGAWW